MKLSTEYRAIARGNLKNNWGTAVLVCVIVMAISTAVSMIPIIGSIIAVIIAGQFVVAELIYFIKLHKNQNPTVGTMFERFSAHWINNCITYLLQIVYTILWTLLFIIPGIIKSYAYSMTMYLKTKNPEMKSNEAISLSQKIMEGKKWKLFCLQFSFIGWAILTIFIFGIGFLFLMPYMQASFTAFYEEAYEEYNQTQLNVEDISQDDHIEIVEE